MKKVVKIGIILIILFSIIAQLNICNAQLIDTGKNDDTYKPSDLGQEQTLVNKANVIAGAIRNIGIVVSVISLMIIGIRAMVGSVEEKAEYKKSIPGYLIGVVLVVVMTLIPSLIMTFVTAMNEQPPQGGV